MMMITAIRGISPGVDRYGVMECQRPFRIIEEPIWPGRSNSD